MTQSKKNNEIEFFDKFCDLDYDVFGKSGYDRILNEFKRYIKPKKGEKLVDFGCGTGAFTKYLLRYKLDIIGIDISPKSIKLAKKRFSKINFIIGDIEKTKLKANSVDIVLFSGVLHHFDDFTKTMKEAYRILKPDGRIFAYDPNKNNPVMWLYRDENSPVCSTKGRTDNERLLTIKEIKKVVKKSGFKKNKIYAISGVTYKYVESNLGKLILPFYNLFEIIFDYLPFSNKYGSFIITCAKK